MTTPLQVDGPRPAVSWVASLPGSWTSDRERLVLLVLACDAFEDTSAPSGAALAAWAGLINGRLYETLATLSRATDRRPALVERVDASGDVIPEGKRGGRERTRYRLRVGVGSAQLSGFTGRDGVPATLPANSPGELSRGTLPASRETSLPFPSSPNNSRSSAPRQTVPVPLPDGWTPNDQHRNAIERAGLDAADLAPRFREAMRSEHRRDWDRAFGAFIAAASEGRECDAFAAAPVPP